MLDLMVIQGSKNVNPGWHYLQDNDILNWILFSKDTLKQGHAKPKISLVRGIPKVTRTAIPFSHTCF